MGIYRYNLGAYGRLIRYVAEIKKEAAVKVLLGLAVNAAYIAQAVVMARAVTLVFTGSGPLSIVPYIIAAFACVLVRGFLARVIEVYGKVMAASVKTKIRLLVFDKILRLGPAYINTKRSGQVQSLVLDGIESLEPFLVNYVPHIITISISGFAIAFYLFSLDALTGLVVIAALAMCVGVPYLTVPLVSKSIVHYWTSYAVLNAQYVDAIAGMATLKTFNAGAAKGRELAADALDFYRKQIRNTTFSLIDSGLISLIMSVVSCLTAALAAYRTSIGVIPAETLPVFLFLGVELARPISDLNTFWHNSFLGLSVAVGLFEIVDMELGVKEKDEPERAALDGKLPDIELRNVSFTYPGGKRRALDNVSLRIEAGQTAAIVGRSGSGKSTLVSLLLRFYDAEKGSVLLSGTDVRDFSLEYLQSRIAVVFQETYLFEGTAEDNIRMSRPDASGEEVESAARTANIHDFIVSLPEGYRTLLGERGANLSGGERQRLAIARAVLKDASVLILDEATSNIDAKSEALVQRSLETLKGARTTLVIAHRLSTVRDADKIFVLDNGVLAEEGTHEELFNRGGIYTRLVRAQTEENKDE